MCNRNKFKWYRWKHYDLCYSETNGHFAHFKCCEIVLESISKGITVFRWQKVVCFSVICEEQVYNKVLYSGMQCEQMSCPIRITFPFSAEVLHEHTLGTMKLPGIPVERTINF